jgi:RHS repeat-associated protein
MASGDTRVSAGKRGGAQQIAKGFTNHEQTDPSGLIYMQARFYAPWFGRFLSPDPARDQHFELTQSWNIYSYVRNAPVMFTDPTGLTVEVDKKDRARVEQLMKGGLAKSERGKVEFKAVIDPSTKKETGKYQLAVSGVDGKSSDALKGLENLAASTTTFNVKMVSEKDKASLNNQLGNTMLPSLVSKDASGKVVSARDVPPETRPQPANVAVNILDLSDRVRAQDRTTGEVFGGSAISSGSLFHELLGHALRYVMGEANYSHSYEGGGAATDSAAKKAELDAERNYGK